jgi:hypothetical protein
MWEKLPGMVPLIKTGESAVKDEVGIMSALGK